MGRAPCCSKVGLHRGPWTTREDALLINYIQDHGEGNWKSLPKKAGLLRCGKSCRLRWVNYLRPDIKRGNIGPDEEDLIIRLHSLLGNRWSLIAGRIPGRTDNEIKNYWNSHLIKKLKRQGIQVREGTAKATSKQSKSMKNYLETKNGAQDKKRKRKLTSIEEEEEEQDEETPKTKIYAPKPTRFTPAMRNSSNATETTQDSEPNVNGTALEDDTGDISWLDGFDNQNEGSVFIEGDINGFLNHGIDCDFQFGLLDRVYEEYSQLLNSGEDDQFPLLSFTESLFL